MSEKVKYYNCERREELYKLFKSDFDNSDYINSVIEQILVPVPFSNSELEKSVAWSLSGKAAKTFRAVKLLCEQGYGPDALVLTRGLLEILLSLMYIQEEDSRARAEMYAQYEWVIKRQGWKREQFIKIDKKEAEKSKAIVFQKYKEARKKYSHFDYKKVGSLSWIPEDKSDLAKRFKIDYHYQVVYWYISQQIHSVPSALQDYVVVSEENNSVTVGPSDNLIRQALGTVNEVMLRILDYTQDVLELDKASVIKEAVEVLTKTKSVSS